MTFRSVHDHQTALDSLNREIRQFTSRAFQQQLTPREADLVASLIEEEDFSASLGETIYQIARRVERHPFGPSAAVMCLEIVGMVDRTLTEQLDNRGAIVAEPSLDDVQRLRQKVLADVAMPAEDRGALLALLGSAERAFYLASRVRSERASVPRSLLARDPAEAAGDARVLPGAIAPSRA